MYRKNRTIVTLKPLIFVLGILVMSCSSGLHIIHVEKDSTGQELKPYVVGMKGAENLAFDGEGSLFATDLDGRLYLIKPTTNDFSGNIEDSKKIGEKGFGLAVGNDGWVYFVREHNGKRTIAKIDKALANEPMDLTDPIEGLNGMEFDGNRYLYVAASNESWFSPKGQILRLNIKSQDKPIIPETVVENIGMTNGISMSPDGLTLYYTETFNGVWAFDIEKKEKRHLYSPEGFLSIVDDLTTAKDGTIWVALNSARAIVPIKAGTATIGYRIGDLGAPSSLKFGKGRGFQSDFLYITELSQSGRSPFINGRGVWAYPKKSLEAQAEEIKQIAHGAWHKATFDWDKHGLMSPWPIEVGWIKT